MKLSRRLKQIDNFLQREYDHIWDCCCDHGLLGNQFLSRKLNGTIHFVDIVPRLIDTLNDRLKSFYGSTTTNWQTHCLDVADIPLTTNNGRHLIIIAGVGGDLTIEIMAKLINRHTELNLEFILCPVHHHYALRSQLSAWNFKLVNEALVKENKRFYEVVHVTRLGEGNKISEAGEQIWQTTNEQQKQIATEYLANTIRHYRRLIKGNNATAQGALTAYLNVTITM